MQDHGPASVFNCDLCVIKGRLCQFPSFLKQPEHQEHVKHASWKSAQKEPSVFKRLPLFAMPQLLLDELLVG